MRAFIGRAIARARGAPAIVGVSAPELASMSTLAASAMDAGAAGVMVAPPGHLRTDDQILSYFDSVAETLGAAPFALQDYPLATQVQIAPKVILRIVDALPTYYAQTRGLARPREDRGVARGERPGRAPHLDPDRQRRPVPARGTSARGGRRDDRLRLP